ncbi:MAG: hypothetical protein LBR26_04220 [Prevotella sp.]|jgi:hypothetical protein|nr:hypothetical protein [Prevotella sp.]
MTRILFLSAILLSLLTGCASIVSKSSYPLTISSTPSEARISITDRSGREVYAGTTPTIVQLKARTGFFAKAEYQVRFRSPGYNEKVVPVLFKIDGWYFGNLLLGGVIGMLIVDPLTGAMWKLESDFLHATLDKADMSGDPQLRILNVNDLPDEWKTHLVKLN